MTNVSCNLCGGSSTYPVFEVERFQKKYNFVKCEKCSLVYLNPMPDSEELNQYYTQQYQYTDFQKYNEADDRRFARELKFIKKHKQKGKFLEVGCMYGFSLNVARKAGFEVYGIERSAVAVEYAKNNFDINIFNGEVSDAKFPENHFDVIYLCHVIEHFQDPLQTLKTLSKFLKADGILVLRCPNFASLQAKILQKNWSWLCPPEHLFQFTPTTLTRILSKAGLKYTKTWTTRGDHNYLRYLPWEFFAALPFHERYKDQYRQELDQNPNHLSQRFLWKLYQFLTPLMALLHQLKYGQELISVSSKSK